MLLVYMLFKDFLEMFRLEGNWAEFFAAN